MYCDRCGTEGGAGNRYCVICGAALDIKALGWKFSPSREGKLARIFSKAQNNGEPFMVTLETRNKALVKLEQLKLQPATSPLGGLVAPSEVGATSLARTRLVPPSVAGVIFLTVGAIALLGAVLYDVLTLTFVGLGLTFWGALFLFARPTGYVKKEILGSIVSSLRAIDDLMVNLGYHEKGVYLADNRANDEVLIFLPRRPLSAIPSPHLLKQRMLIDNPEGIVLVPPGLDLERVFEQQLRTDFTKKGLAFLQERLGKLLIDDLEIAHSFNLQTSGDRVTVKFVDSAYAEFCNGKKGIARVCSSLGCPLCSAMACVLAKAVQKPVVFEGETFSDDGRTNESKYRIIEV